MKCCASPTISSVPKIGADGSGPANTIETRELAAQFNALLMKAAFAPVARALGFYGDLVVGDVALSLARREEGGLTERFATLLDNARGSTGDAK